MFRSNNEVLSLPVLSLKNERLSLKLFCSFVKEQKSEFESLLLMKKKEKMKCGHDHSVTSPPQRMTGPQVLCWGEGRIPLILGFWSY